MGCGRTEQPLNRLPPLRHKHLQNSQGRSKCATCLIYRQAYCHSVEEEINMFPFKLARSDKGGSLAKYK